MHTAHHALHKHNNVHVRVSMYVRIIIHTTCLNMYLLLTTCLKSERRNFTTGSCEQGMSGREGEREGGREGGREGRREEGGRGREGGRRERLRKR